mgnify:CR=1 FL=1
MTTVALTTTSDRSGDVVPLLEKSGLTAVEMPCIRVDPAPPKDLGATRKAVGQCDLLFVTSARALNVLWPDGDMPAVSVAAVGKTTAELAMSLGGDVVLTGDTGANALVTRVSPLARRKSVVFPHGNRSDRRIAGRLDLVAGSLFTKVVYEVSPVAPELTDVDAVIFGSPSSVEGWLMSRPLDGLTVAAIGDTTARAVRESGSEVDVMPARPSFPDCVKALAAHMRERKSR